MPVTPDTSPEVVSPELVLVDPDLAQRRKAIELTGAWTPAVHAASIRSRSVPVVEVESKRVATKRRTRRRPTLVAVAALLLVSATAVLVLRGESATKGKPGTSIATPSTTVATPSTTVGSLTTPTTLTQQAAPAAPPAPKKKAAARRSTPRTIKVNWQPVKFATFYHVVLVRGGRQLDIWTPRSALTVQALRSGRGLRPGRYRWSVRPGYGNFQLRKVAGRTFYGPVVARGVFRVPRRAS